MDENYCTKLVIRYEYEKSVKDKWNKESFQEYLLNELAKYKVKENKEEQAL